MFGRSERKTPFQREQNQKLENLRDDCIALFINSGLTQKQIHERGGPTPATGYDNTQKAHRWLGYAQCLAICLGLTDLETMKRINKEA